SLREKLVDKLARVNGIASSPERIASAPGGVGAIAGMFAAGLEWGDEVLLPHPGWPNYRMMLPWLGARGVYYPCPPASGFQPDLEALEHLITPRTRILVVNSPNNPTGAVYPTATIGAMIQLAQRHNLWLLSDECYDQIVLDGTWTSPAHQAQPPTSWPTSPRPVCPPGTSPSPCCASGGSAWRLEQPSARWPGARSGSASRAQTPISVRALAGWPNSYTVVPNPGRSFKLRPLKSGVTVPAYDPFGPTCSF